MPRIRVPEKVAEIKAELRNKLDQRLKEFGQEGFMQFIVDGFLKPRCR